MLEGIWAVANPAVFLLAYSNDCFSSQRKKNSIPPFSNVLFFFFFSKLVILKHFSAPQDVCIASAHQSPFAPISISSMLLAERGAALP